MGIFKKKKVFDDDFPIIDDDLYTYSHVTNCESGRAFAFRLKISELIKEFSDKHNIDCVVVDTLEEAVKCAYSISNEGDTILLSPACASWDQYDSFEDRGKKFKEVINLLNE